MSSSVFDSLLGLPTTFSLSELFYWVKENRALSLGALLGFCVLYAVRYVTSPYRKLPPGPRGYPIIGNVSSFDHSSGSSLQNGESSMVNHISQCCRPAHGYPQLSEGCRRPA
ncbi:hypothetical protein BJV77DRAFT_1080020 [Russula vinacea]|nr:hypothetical protein BJV77DRAFT_1080020 [Russula vinacea]